MNTIFTSKTESTRASLLLICTTLLLSLGVDAEESVAPIAPEQNSRPMQQGSWRASHASPDQCVADQTCTFSDSCQILGHDSGTSVTTRPFYTTQNSESITTDLSGLKRYKRYTLCLDVQRISESCRPGSEGEAYIKVDAPNKNLSMIGIENPEGVNGNGIGDGWETQCIEFRTGRFRRASLTIGSGDGEFDGGFWAWSNPRIQKTRTIRCGNGEVDLTEQCDDGNRDNRDGCTESCIAFELASDDVGGGDVVVSEEPMLDDDFEQSTTTSSENAEKNPQIVEPESENESITTPNEDELSTPVADSSEVEGVHEDSELLRSGDNADGEVSGEGEVINDTLLGSHTRDDSIDRDGDGLPDALEDKNGNGIQDWGETDALNPDSDLDGVIDGDEDQNRNGEFDIALGESNPLNPCDPDPQNIFCERESHTHDTIDTIEQNTSDTENVETFDDEVFNVMDRHEDPVTLQEGSGCTQSLPATIDTLFIGLAILLFRKKSRYDIVT